MCHKHFDECKQVCHHLLKSEHLDKAQRISVIKILIKAEFSLYEQENKWYLTYKDIFPKEKVLYLKESKLQRAKVIIEYINEYKIQAIDNKFVMYLDIAMMECTRFNELQELNCCMLCLKQGQKLQRSHIIPKSILHNFRKAIKQYSGNIAFQLINSFTHSSEKLFTDKTLTKYMLCKKCEAILNVNGEQPFYQNFFQTIYNPVIEDCLSLAHEVLYEKWLYHFSIGIIFRCIAAFTGIPYVVNDDIVYNLFTCCRKYLLNEELSVQCLPAVYIFINQASPLLESDQQWLHQTLVGPAMFYISKFRAIDGVGSAYPSASFVLAKIGIINIVVDLSLADNLQLSQVNPLGGLFKVPTEHERYLLPGIREVYSLHSKQCKERFENSMYRKNPYAPKVIDGKNYISFKKSFKIDLGIDSDNKIIQSRMKKVAVKCLPSNFILDHNHGVVEFPSPYTLLLHYNSAFSDADGIADHDYNIMLFIGIKKLKLFFVFYEDCSEHSLCFGCTFSHNDYSIEEYITDAPLNTYDLSIVERIKELSTQFIPIAIRNAIMHCGFSSLHSLLYQYQYK